MLKHNWKQVEGKGQKDGVPTIQKGIFSFTADISAIRKRGTQNLNKLVANDSFRGL